MLFHQHTAEEEGGGPNRDAQSPNQLEQTPIGGVQVSVQPNFSSSRVYFNGSAAFWLLSERQTAG